MKKLNEESVRDIKRRLAAGESYDKIKATHNISKTQISLIKTGSRYAKVKI